MNNRIAIWSTEAMGSRGDYHVAKVTENEAGYTPLGHFPTLEEARAYAQDRNERNGLSVDDVMDIVASSMRMKY